MWSFVLGFLQHSGLRVPRRQAPVTKHVIWPFACIVFADVSLAKVSHMTNLSLNAGEAHARLSVPVHLGSERPDLVGLLLSQSTTHSRLCLALGQNSSNPV